jgi:anti-anti-sigma factor
MSPTFSLADVRVLGVPVEIWARASEHQEAIQREFDIMRPTLASDAPPTRLQALVGEFNDQFGGVGDPAWEELRAAAARGDVRVDLVFTVPVRAAAATRQLGEVLDEVDAFCRSGKDMLTLATPSDLVRFRKWLLGEFTRQIDEALDPLSWDDYLAASVDDEGDAAEPGASEASEDSAVIVFTGNLDLATAATLRDRIQEQRTAGAGTITLDMSKLRFIDSVGMGLLVSTHNRFVQDGLRMRLLLPERLRSLVEITGLVNLLEPEFTIDA